MLDLDPLLSPADALALHQGDVPVAWLVLPAPGGNGVIARPHTMAHDGGRWLPGHVAAGSLDELRGLLPNELVLEEGWTPGTPPDGLGWFL